MKSLIWVTVLFAIPWLEYGIFQLTGAALPLIFVHSLFTGLIGCYFARQERLDLWSLLEAEVANGRVPTVEGVDAMLIVLGGWALIIPGWITDLMGVAFVVPPLRRMLIPAIREFIRSRLV